MVQMWNIAQTIEKSEVYYFTADNLVKIFLPVRLKKSHLYTVFEPTTNSLQSEHEKVLQKSNSASFFASQKNELPKYRYYPPYLKKCSFNNHAQ